MRTIIQIERLHTVPSLPRAFFLPLLLRIRMDGVCRREDLRCDVCHVPLPSIRVYIDIPLHWSNTGEIFCSQSTHADHQTEFHVEGRDHPALKLDVTTAAFLQRVRIKMAFGLFSISARSRRWRDTISGLMLWERSQETDSAPGQHRPDLPRARQDDMRVGIGPRSGHARP
jgi:hypothetical protein